MLNNYFKTTIRHLLKNKIYFFINMLGLAIGIACFVLISLYVYNELNYDRHHKKADRTYRQILKGNMGGSYLEAAVTGGPMGPILYKELPEVVEFTQIQEVRRSVLLTYLDRYFFEENIIYADSSFFRIFDFDFVQGDPETALIQPFSLVLSQKIARKFFGDENPVGKTIKWNNRENFLVTAVIKDSQGNTHLQKDIYASFSTLMADERSKSLVNDLFAFMTFNYVVVNDRDVDLKKLQQKVDTLVEKHMGSGMRDFGGKFSVSLQPLSAIHLHSHLLHEMGRQGDISQVYIFSAIAFLILIIACINFINLSTARSAKRALEVGMRKVFGADRKRLIMQFISESILVSFISLIISMVFIEIVRPFFNDLAGTSFGVDWFGNVKYLLFIIVLTGFVGLAAGIYPAVFLSSFRPVKVFKSDFITFSGKAFFRNALVVFQFTISVFLIFGTLVIYQQLRFINKKDLGFNKEDLMIVPLRGAEMTSRYATIRAELLNIPGVDGVSASSSYLGNFGQRQGYYPEGNSRKDAWMLLNLQVDYNFTDVIGAKLLKGRNFSENIKADSNVVLINEALAKEMGLEDPVGHFILQPTGEDESTDRRFKIVGVVKDFSYASLHESVKPLLINNDPRNYRYLNIRLNAQNQQSTIALLGQKWDSMFPEQPLNYFFVEEKYLELYTSDMKMGNLFFIFTILAIFIASLGLFGLVLYIIERRTREIGIKKVFGSTVSLIVLQMNLEFIKWVILASVIAWLIGWYFMDKWLQNFAFQSPIKWWFYAAASFLAIIIAAVTISWQAFKSARKNPIDALRYE